MTYWQFHLAFILPVMALLWILRPRVVAWNSLRAGLKAIGLTTILALLYTFPWDNYLIAKGGWSYPPDRVLATLGYVPLEEILFFALMTILTGLLSLQFLKRTRVGFLGSFTTKWTVLAAYLLLSLAGWWMLLMGGQWFYLGMILGFFMPILAISWAVGGQYIARYPGEFWLPVIVSTIYLWACDWFAIVQQGIWSVSAQLTTGVNLFGLPLEEMVFFLVVNMVIVQSVMLFSHPHFAKYLGEKTA